MISRCPSCGSQVDDEAKQCPKCYWDFALFKRVPPPEKAAPAPEAKPPEAKPPEVKPPQTKVLEDKDSQAKAVAPPPQPQKPPAVEKSVRPAPAELPIPQAPGKEFPQGDWPPLQPSGGGLGFAIPVLPKTPAPPPIIGPIVGLGGTAPASEKKPPPPQKEPTTPKPAPPAHPQKEAPPAQARSTTPQGGGGWGSPSAPGGGGRPEVSRPSTRVVPQPMRPSRPLVQWFAVGALLVGLLFVVATYVALRPEPEGRIPHGSPAVFPKDPRPDGAKVLAPLEQIIASEAGKAAPGPSASTATEVSAPSAPVAPEAKPEPPAPAAPLPAPEKKPEAAQPAAPAIPPDPAVAVPHSAPSRPAPAKPKAGPRWVFEGSVYDLISLQAVFSAKLTFSDASGKVCGEAVTGDGGRYRIALEPLAEGAYSLSVRHHDYREKYIDEINPPFRELGAEDRRGLVDMASRARPWMGQTSSATRRDFVMIPKLVSE